MNSTDRNSKSNLTMRVGWLTTLVVVCCGLLLWSGLSWLIPAHALDSADADRAAGAWRKADAQIQVDATKHDAGY